MTKFSLVQIESIYRQQIQEHYRRVFQMVESIVEMEKLLVTSIFFTFL